MSQIENLHAPKSAKKEIPGSEPVPIEFNYKLKKENYTGFSILQKPKVPISQPKSLRWVEQHQPSPLFENLKEKGGDYFSRSKLSRYTFEKYY